MSEEDAVLAEVSRLFAIMDPESRAKFAKKLEQIMRDFDGKEDFEGNRKYKEGYGKGYRMGLKEGKIWAMGGTREVGERKGGDEEEEEEKAFL
jgi:hypothetical protein